MNLKKLALIYICIALLIVSYFTPCTRALWNALDIYVFETLNQTLQNRPYLYTFWALFTDRKLDWVEDIVLLVFFTIAVREQPKGERVRKSAEFLFCVLIALLILLLITGYLFSKVLDIPRLSPSLVLPSVDMKPVLEWIKYKDRDTGSFPGDHATSILYFAIMYTFFAGRRLGKYLWVYAIFRCLPRIVLGAHWLSDIVMGSAVIATLTSSTVMYTGLYVKIVDGLEKFLKCFKKKSN